MSGLIIRKATKEDTSLILGFIKELADFEKLSHEVLATEDSLKTALFTNSRGAEAIIGEFNGKAVSFALYFHNFSTFLGKSGLYLEDLYVQPAYRSNGIGIAMLKYLSALAVERGCGRFEWAVLDWNEKAIALYKKIGATPMNEWTTFRLSGQALLDMAAKPA